MRHRLASTTPARGGDELREAAHIAAFRAIHGEAGDPLESPETFDFASKVADAILASTDMAGATVPDRLARRMGAEFVARDDVSPVEGLTSGEGRDKAIERAARYVLENSRRGNASLNSEQFDADTDKLMTAYRDIIGKAMDSGALFAPKATATASVREPWPGYTADMERRRVVTLAKVGQMLSIMAGGEAAEVEGYDAGGLYAEVLMSLGVEDAEFPDLALQGVEDDPEAYFLTDSGTAATIGGERA